MKTILAIIGGAVVGVVVAYVAFFLFWLRGRGGMN